jgi:acetylglutamate kinase
MALLKDRIFMKKLLTEGISSIRKFSGETIVVKYGGTAMGDINKIKSFASDVVLLKQCGIDIIVVHGAGPRLGQMLDKFKIKTSVVDNVRISTKENIDVVEMILSGHINKQMVTEINLAGGVALGFSGKDAGLMTATKVKKTYRETDSNIERILDFGCFGIPHKINTEIFEVFADSPVIPVISPVGYDEDGNTYNVNADNVAGAVAGALHANRLILMTEYDGILDSDNKIIHKLSRLEAESLKKTKIITGVMRPKLDVCLDALKSGVLGAHIINTSTPNGLLFEVLTKDRIGTLIFNNESMVRSEEFEFDDC